MPPDLPLILLAGFVATASPGPATITIAETAISRGKMAALPLAMGVVTGSIFWSLAASLGVAAIMVANVWALEALRYCGAAYLLYLAFKAARSAFGPEHSRACSSHGGNAGRMYLKGLLLHLTNPKAILFFGSLYAIGLPPDTSLTSLVIVVVALGMQSLAIFTGYALLFSSRIVAQGYLRLRRWLQGLFALAFAGASLKVLTARLG